jgi:hypothetical protein
MGVITYTDWFLGSKDVVQEMHDELLMRGVGGFTNDLYWSSSEYDATLAYVIDFNVYNLSGIELQIPKTMSVFVFQSIKCRACRLFTSATNYNLRDIGPAGGYIFWKSGSNYLEAAPSDSVPVIWSNITTLIGSSAQGIAIGTGQANTNAIIGQIGHTTSAAKLCDDLIITVTTTYTPPPVISYGASRIYTFYITIGSSLVEVFPLNFLESKLVDYIEDDEIFHRRKFTGSLTFTNLRGDFDMFYAIWEIDPASEIIFTINRAGILYWSGYFTPTDGKFDNDKCLFEITPLQKDDYADILVNAKIQYNILSIIPPVTTRALMGSIDVTYTRNRWLIDVIEYLADKIKPGVVVASEFFTNIINPATLNANHLNYLTIAQKSDIKRPTSSDPATSAMLSWKELMEIIWGMFQVKWIYESSIDTIHVEHISWFTTTAGLDMRTQLLTKATNKFSYKKENMPKYEKFSFIEAKDLNFIGCPIWYDSKGVSQDKDNNTKEINVNVTTDLEYIINEADSISDSGFVILCNYLDDGSYYVSYDFGILTGGDKLNFHLSWASLHYYYFRNNRVLIEGYVNNKLTTFFTALKTIIQECFAKICTTDNFDPENFITTELGETYLSGAKAEVEQSELSPSGEMKLSLLYGPVDNINTSVPDYLVPHISISQDDDMLGAILTESAPIGGLDIIIHNTDCGGTPNADIVWTIPEGVNIDTFSITHLKILSINLADPLSWDIDFIPDVGYVCA